jgi:hypothetical protein
MWCAHCGSSTSGTPFTARPYGASDAALWTGATVSAMALPRLPNPFVPTQLDLLKAPKSAGMACGHP